MESHKRPRSARLARNYTLYGALGIVMLVVGTVGLIVFGSQAIDRIEDPGFMSTDEAKFLQAMEYVFMFTMIGGLVLALYSMVSRQSEKAKAREAAERRISDKTTDTTEAA